MKDNSRTHILASWILSIVMMALLVGLGQLALDLL